MTAHPMHGTCRVQRFLYLSPYFPPDVRVGAQRPLRFVRHLEPLGWAATVLCDFRSHSAVHWPLAKSIPASTRVVRDYSRHALDASADRVTKPRRTGGSSRVERAFTRIFDNPELFPLGEHAFDLPHAFRAALRILREETIDLIVVNADPFATAVLGAVLSRHTGIPLVLDFRDPWSLCELRRPMRPAATRRAVEAMEAWCFETAAAVVLNTETAREQYARAYDRLGSDRFHCIRNHADVALTGGGTHPGFDRYTLLNLGGFRRFTEGDTLLSLLAELQARGLGDEVQLVVTGACPPALRRMAEGLGVGGMLVEHPFVAPTEMGGVLRAADLLVALNSNTVQRLPAKLFDYVTADRPILAVCHNPELHRVCDAMGGARAFARRDVSRMADYVQSEMRRGRQRAVVRDVTPWSSAEAARKLSGIFESVLSRACVPELACNRAVTPQHT